MEEALEVGGSLALAGNELLQDRTLDKILRKDACEPQCESCLSNDSGE